MTTALTILKKTLPKPTTIAEAINMDSKLSYHSISDELFQYVIKTDEKELLAKQETVFLSDKHPDYSFKVDVSADILSQIKRYSERPEGNPKLILYQDQSECIVIKAVSALFAQIPLAEVWKTAIKHLGEPISEKPTNQAIVAQFTPVYTKYKQGGAMVEKEYQIHPTIAFSYNFAERAFQLGFVVGVVQCANQIFCFFGDSKIVHNIYKIEKQGFQIDGAISNLITNVTRLEEIIAEAQNTPLPAFAVPALYWKGSRQQARVIEKVYAEHARLIVKKGTSELSLWDGIMNLTFVSTHETPNYNSSVDMSSVAGKLLIDLGKLEPDDYVRALGYYMFNKRKTAAQATRENETPFFHRVKLASLMNHVADILEMLITDEYQTETDTVVAEVFDDKPIVEPVPTIKVQEAQEIIDSVEKSKGYKLEDDEKSLYVPPKTTGSLAGSVENIQEGKTCDVCFFGKYSGRKDATYCINTDAILSLRYPDNMGSHFQVANPKKFSCGNWQNHKQPTVKPSEIAVRSLEETKEKYKPLIDDVIEADKQGEEFREKLGNMTKEDRKNLFI